MILIIHDQYNVYVTKYNCVTCSTFSTCSYICVYFTRTSLHEHLSRLYFSLILLSYIFSFYLVVVFVLYCIIRFKV